MNFANKFLIFALAASVLSLLTDAITATSPENSELPITSFSTEPPVLEEVCPPFENATETETFPHVSISNSTRCGEVFDCKTGGIFYKPFDKVDRHERCMWTIAVPAATGYEVTVQYFGFTPQQHNENGHGLIISDFGLGRNPNHFIPMDTNVTTIGNASMLVVTFTSGGNSNRQKGFVLQFKATFNGTLPRPVSLSSRHFLFGEKAYFHRYTSPTNYERNVLTSFLFAPAHNIARSAFDNVVVLMQNSALSCSSEYLKVYLFNSTCVGAHKWQFHGRICGTATDVQRELIRSPEPILVILEADGNYRSYDFQFTYSTGI